jgi:hypothetical protein
MAARNWWGKSSASLCAHMLSGVPNFNGRVYPSGDFFFSVTVTMSSYERSFLSCSREMIDSRAACPCATCELVGPHLC